MESLNIVFAEQGKVITQREDVPQLKPNEVLIKTEKTLISTGTEGIILNGLYEPGTHWHDWIRFPFRPGYSLAGRIVAMGSDVTGLAEGQRVAARAGHRQYAITTAQRVCAIPDGVTDEEATWHGLASIVQVGVRRAQHTMGETIIIIGVGILGQLVTQYVRLMGAQRVIVIDPASMRTELALAHGATHALTQTVETAHEAAMAQTGGVGADIVYDATGNANVLHHALPLVRRFGRLLLLGDTGTPSKQTLTRDVVTRGVQIIGAHDGYPPPAANDYTHWSHANQVALVFTYLQRKDMRVSDLVTHRYAPTDAPEAFRMLRDERPSALGVIFDWNQLA
jgi:2-desacetyl-2-hydroxyethyl bacteriochlorophyllide A dehydrogenase